MLNAEILICLFDSDVGNKSAVFPLQVLGFDVDVVNSVQFSNHTGYPNGFDGDILKGDQLLAILSGLQRNDLLSDIGHILTGYIGSESFLEAIIDVVTTVRSINQTVRYVCDPVLGDKGKFYVPPSLVEVYKTKVLPIADVITPNQFEVEQLTGVATKTIKDAIEACCILHDMGPSLVFITSLVFEDTENKEEEPSTLAILASSRRRNKNKNDSNSNSGGSDTKQHDPSIQDEIWQIDCPILPGQYTGTGDLTAALLLAHSSSLVDCDEDLSDTVIPNAMEKVINTMFATLERTHSYSATSNATDVKARELRLIQCKDIIENPPQRFKSTRIQ